MAFTCTGKLNVKQLLIMQPNESYIAKQNHVTAHRLNSILDRDSNRLNSILDRDLSVGTTPVFILTLFKFVRCMLNRSTSVITKTRGRWAT